MLTVVCWKWKPPPGYRSTFLGTHVNVLRSMVARHYRIPHRFVCVTDDPAGIDQSSIEIVKLWEDYSRLPSPHGRHMPSCYRRLRMFSDDARFLFGDRFVSLDLDCVITADLSPLWDRPEDFVIWGDTNPRTPYNGSMMLMKAGSRSKVWTEFHPVRSPALAKKMGYYGSDQAWIGACLGRGEAIWGQADGVYSFRNHVRAMGTLPRDARIVIFHGRHDPWDSDMQKIGWVRENWR